MNQRNLLYSMKCFLSEPTLGVLYGLVILIYQIFYGIVPARIAIQNSFLSGFSPSLAVIGFVLLFMSLLADPDRFRQREMRISWLLILVLVLSTVVNHERGMRENIKTIIWQVNLMLLVFSSWVKLGERYSENSEKGFGYDFSCKTVRYTVCLLLLILDIAVVCSLVQFFRLSCSEILTHDTLFHFGLYEGRLYGVFTTPYSAALVNVYAMMASLFYMLSSPKKCKGFLIVSCILSATMIVLSGTRTVLLGILLSVFIVTIMIQIGRASAAINVKRRFLTTIFAVFLALNISAGVYLFQMGYGRVLQGTAAFLNGLSDETMENMDNLMRDDMSENISSNRFGIWKDYIHVLLDRPEKLILGYSPCGYMGYIDDNYPDLFIVQYFREQYPINYFINHEVYAPHNAILAVLISSGITGLGLLTALAVIILRLIILHYRRGRFRTLDYCILGMLITTVTGMMFESDVFYYCNTTSAAFWMMIGFMYSSVSYHGKRFRTDGRHSHSRSNILPSPEISIPKDGTAVENEMRTVSRKRNTSK